jgi:hypothetical protein
VSPHCATRARSSSSADADSIRRIDHILDADRGRWISLSYDRLHTFGYRFDTF